MHNYKAQAERTDEAERLLTPAISRGGVNPDPEKRDAFVRRLGSGIKGWDAFSKANRSPSKWAPLIEQCEMGNEAGAEKVLQLLREADKMADTLRGIRAAMEDQGGFDNVRCTITSRLEEWEAAR